jgi:hypothetical protein
MLRLLSVGRLSSTEWIQPDRQFKAIAGFARLIGPGTLWRTWGTRPGVLFRGPLQLRPFFDHPGNHTSALRLSGDKSKAKAAYQDFLTLGKDGDPDIPIFKQAKAEYAELQ